jgi:hypothetical protein
MMGSPSFRRGLLINHCTLFRVSDSFNWTLFRQRVAHWLRSHAILGDTRNRIPVRKVPTWSERHGVTGRELNESELRLQGERRVRKIVRVNMIGTFTISNGHVHKFLCEPIGPIRYFGRGNVPHLVSRLLGQSAESETELLGQSMLICTN